MRVLITGSRSYEDRAPIHLALNLLSLSLEPDESLVVINGFASGADRMADEWASDNDRGRPWRFDAGWDMCDSRHPLVPCPVASHRKTKRGSEPTQVRTYCPLAGLRRNADMLTEGQPSLVLAFTDKPLKESKGTADMVRRALNAGIPVQYYGPESS